MQSPSDMFGGLSGLGFTGPDHRLVMVSDRGNFISGQLIYDEQGGSAGLLRDGKGGTFEGGMRVPGIFWWPGRIAPGVVRDIGCTMDVFATAVTLAGGAPGEVDGVDLSGALLKGGASARASMVYYRDDEWHGDPVRIAYMFMHVPNESHRRVLIQVGETHNKRQALVPHLIAT